MTFDGVKAEMKFTRSAGNTVKYAKETVRKQGAEIVLFEFTADTAEIREAIAELSRKGIRGMYYFKGHGAIYDIQQNKTAPTLAEAELVVRPPAK